MKSKLQGVQKSKLLCSFMLLFFVNTISLFATNCPGVILNFTSSSVNPTCNTPDGTVAVQGVTGGSGVYTFSLNGGPAQVPVNPPFNEFSFNNIISGTYSITISDGSCDTTIFLTLGSSIGGVDSVGVTVVNSSCTANTGSITLQPFPAGVVVQQYLLNTGITDPTGQFSGLASGSYSVTLLDANNCTYIVNGIVISTPPPPTAINLVVSQPACQGATGSFEILNVTGGTGPYRVSVNGSAFQSTFTLSGLNPGNYLITIKDNNGCTYSENVLINAATVVSRDCNAGADKTINFGDNIVLEGVKGIGTSAVWSPGVFLSDSAATSPTAFPPSTTVFTLTTTSPEGCVCVDRVTVVVVPLIEAPNTFTPNEDGVNDVWVLRFTGFYEGVNLYIYNRYGERIYDVKEFGPGLEWDGKFKGNYVPTATYYYVLNFRFIGEETVFTYTGSITVIK